MAVSRDRADYPEKVHLAMEVSAEMFYGGDIDSAWDHFFGIWEDTQQRQQSQKKRGQKPTGVLAQLQASSGSQ